MKKRRQLKSANTFLENYNNQNFSKEDTYYIDANDKDIPYDSSIIKECTENEFYWVAFYDEHTVFIYKGAFFHTARGYLVTDGTTQKMSPKSLKNWGLMRTVWRSQKQYPIDYIMSERDCNHLHIQRIPCQPINLQP